MEPRYSVLLPATVRRRTRAARAAGDESDLFFVLVPAAKLALGMLAGDAFADGDDARIFPAGFFLRDAFHAHGNGGVLLGRTGRAQVAYHLAPLQVHRRSPAIEALQRD